MNFATITGIAYQAFGPELTPARTGTVTFTPIDLDDSANIVASSTKVARIGDDGTFGEVSLWPGLWRISYPGGTIEAPVEGGQTYSLLDLRGPVAPVGGTLNLLEVPDQIPDGHLLSKTGDTLQGVDPATLGGGGGSGAADPNWIDTAGQADSATTFLPGVQTSPWVSGAWPARLNSRLFTPFILTAPGVVRGFMVTRAEGANTMEVVLYKLNAASDLEVVERLGSFAGSGNFTVGYNKALPAGIYYVGTEYTVVGGGSAPAFFTIPAAMGRGLDGSGFPDSLALNGPGMVALGAAWVLPLMGGYA